MKSKQLRYLNDIVQKLYFAGVKNLTYYQHIKPIDDPLFPTYEKEKFN